MDELYREDYWEKLPILLNSLNYAGKEALKLLKNFNVDKDFGIINNNYLETLKQEKLKELAESYKKVEKAYSNADRIMALDKQRREAKN